MDLSRIELNEDILERHYEYKKPKASNAFKDCANYVKKYYRPNRQNVARFLADLFYFLKWLPKYKFKEYFPRDFLGGLTLGVVLIPQTIGYSLMGGLPPYQGLYTVPIAMFVYFIFGTATHVALAIFAAVTMLIKKETDNLDGIIFSSNGTKDERFISNDPVLARVYISAMMAFLGGIFQILFALSHFGEFFTKYLSDVIVIAYTCATSYIIVIEQLFPIFGIKNSTPPTHFESIESLIKFFSNLNQINYATLIIAFICMSILYLIKYHINEKYKHKLIVPIPIEFIVLLIATLLSHFFNFEKKWNVRTIGALPIGYPNFMWPKFQYFSTLILPSFNVAIVSYSINVSIAKLFSRKHKYSFRPNREAFAYGLGNIIVSLFQGVPNCGGLSRCAILEGIGVHTLVYSLFSGTIILCVIFFVGASLSALPIAALASIITVALLKLCFELKQFFPIYRKNKNDGISFIVTWLGVVILNVDYGLYLAMIVSVFLILIENQRAPAYLMGNLTKTDIYDCIDSSDKIKEIKGIKIIRFESSLYYANIERFEKMVKKLSGVDTACVQATIEEKRRSFRRISCKKNFQQTDVVNDREIELELMREIDSIISNLPVRYIVLDFSCVNLIDTQSVEAIVKLNQSYNSIGVSLHFSHVKRQIMRLLNKSNFKDHFNYRLIYPSTHDAVTSILRQSDQANGGRDGGVYCSTSSKYASKTSSADKIDMLAAEDDMDEGSEAEDAIIEPVYQSKVNKYDALNKIVNNL